MYPELSAENRELRHAAVGKSPALLPAEHCGELCCAAGPALLGHRFKKIKHFGTARALRALTFPTDSLDFMSLSLHSHFLFCLSGLPGGGIALRSLAGLSRQSCRGQGASWCQDQVFSSHLRALHGLVKAREPQHCALALVM